MSDPLDDVLDDSIVSPSLRCVDAIAAEFTKKGVPSEPLAAAHAAVWICEAIGHPPGGGR